ncbi:MAG: hypothetical protein A2X08_06735 [Bacteroidetes bacterium GWA2_32_17]|nr:MAG: hypothetical protein A2X08_06735 [Bacteroidetes bacterium GWA2_32_17]
MKKTLLSLSLITAMFTGNAQLFFYDGFDYAVDDSIAQHNWTGFNSGDMILVSSGSLSYSGLSQSIGNKVSFSDYGRDDYKTITTVTSGTIYVSFILQVTNIDSIDINGGYFAGVGASTSLFASTVWTKKNGTGFNIGLNARSSIAYTTWSTEVFQINTPIFIVVSYEMVVGTTNDVAKMWINPVPTSLGTASAPTETISIINGGTDLVSLDRVFLRQDSRAETPTLDIDEIRAGITWTDATPTTTGINEILNVNSMKVFPNPTSDFVTISAKENITLIQIFDIQGRIVIEYNFNGTSEIKLNVCDLPKGLYNIIAISTKGNTFSTKLIK